jgi:ribose transport system permease protein
VVLTGLNAANVGAGSDVAVVLAIGLGVGLVNGLGVALFDISPLVMTLGMNSVLEGVTLIYTGGSPKGYAPSFSVTLATGSTGLPNVVILWIVLALMVTGILVFTKFGRYVYSVGSNRSASEYAALPVRSTLVTAYVISALAATLGGILLTGYSGQAYLGMGTSYLLPSIAVVVIGGTSIYGGKGSYMQTVAGALMITFVESALVTIQVGPAGQDVLYGTIILMMAGLNQAAVGRDVRRWNGRAVGWAIGWLTPIRDRGGGATTSAGGS